VVNSSLFSGHQRHKIGFGRDGDPYHFLRRRHFKIQLGLNDLPEQSKVPILNVAPILP